MKRALAVWAVLLGIVTAGHAQVGNQQIVFVDLDLVFSEFYKTKLADAQLKEQADEFSEERKEMLDEFQKMQDQFAAIRDEAQNTALRESVRSEKRSEAEEKLVELREYEAKIRRFEESRRKQLDDQSRRMRKRIVEEIKVVIQNFARTQGYLAVVDSSGQTLNGVETVIYVDPRVDVTEKVLEMLNKGKQDETQTP